MLLMCRFAPGQDPDEQAAFLARARTAMALLADQPGCRGAELGHAPDDPGRWVLTASFDSVTAYRRALQPFDVREHVVPWLSEALADEPATFERRLTAGPDGVREHDVVVPGDMPRAR